MWLTIRTDARLADRAVITEGAEIFTEVPAAERYPGAAYVSADSSRDVKFVTWRRSCFV